MELSGRIGDQQLLEINVNLKSLSAWLRTYLVLAHVLDLPLQIGLVPEDPRMLLGNGIVFADLEVMI